jgi:hypothetical protein
MDVLAGMDARTVRKRLEPRFKKRETELEKNLY